jgi:glycerophosphoryl diester phosphodiesterase
MKTTKWLIASACVVIALAGCSSGVSDMTEVEIIAHRGASYLAPENTVAAAQLAWAKGADAVEVDVHLSQDGRVMVIHDGTTEHTAGEDLAVAATPSSRLRRLDVGSFKDAGFAGERIPFLSEIIATVPPGRKLFVEIKCGPEILSPLENVIEASGKRARIVIIGFDLETVKAAKRLMPDVPTYWLVAANKDERTDEWIPHDPRLVDEVTSSGLDGLNVHWAGVTKAFAERVRAAGIGLYVWTANDPVEAKRLARLGVKGITTDRPGWLRTRLRGSTR